jgi:hypothetical protein
VSWLILADRERYTFELPGLSFRGYMYIVARLACFLVFGGIVDSIGREAAQVIEEARGYNIINTTTHVAKEHVRWLTLHSGCRSQGGIVGGFMFRGMAGKGGGVLCACFRW